MLQLQQLSDSNLPVGAQSHSFGLETLTHDGSVSAAHIEAFLRSYLAEVGIQEGVFCRASHQMGIGAEQSLNPDWLMLNRRLSALRTARESREASAMLGRRLLTLAAGTFTENTVLHQAIHAAKDTNTDTHYVTAFGLISGTLAIDETAALLAYLQQQITGQLTAAQKLISIGQNQIAAILWRLKPDIVQIGAASTGLDWQHSIPPAFPVGMEVASMRHQSLPTRLFIS